MACGILVPQLGIEPVPPASKGEVLAPQGSPLMSFILNAGKLRERTTVFSIRFPCVIYLSFMALALWTRLRANETRQADWPWDSRLLSPVPLLPQLLSGGWTG